MTSKAQTTQIDPGAMHNVVLKRYYAKRRMTALLPVTGKVFRAILKDVGEHVADLGFDAADVERIVQQASSEVPRMAVFEGGSFLTPAHKAAALLAKEITTQRQISRPLGAELQRIGQLGQTELPTIRAQLAILSRKATTPEDTRIIDTFVNVGTASADFWAGESDAQAKALKNDSGVIIVDAYGALIGLFYPAPGVASIILGTAFSVAANEASR